MPHSRSPITEVSFSGVRPEVGGEGGSRLVELLRLRMAQPCLDTRKRMAATARGVTGREQGGDTERLSLEAGR